jgi:hypothetical protein
MQLLSQVEASKCRDSSSRQVAKHQSSVQLTNDVSFSYRAPISFHIAESGINIIIFFHSTPTATRSRIIAPCSLFIHMIPWKYCKGISCCLQK